MTSKSSKFFQTEMQVVKVGLVLLSVWLLSTLVFVYSALNRLSVEKILPNDTVWFTIINLLVLLLQLCAPAGGILLIGAGLRPKGSGLLGIACGFVAYLIIGVLIWLGIAAFRDTQLTNLPTMILNPIFLLTWPLWLFYFILIQLGLVSS